MIIDAAIKPILDDYSSAIQNQHRIKKPGINVWNQQDRKWSEAAKKRRLQKLKHIHGKREY